MEKHMKAVMLNYKKIIFILWFAFIFEVFSIMAEADTVIPSSEFEDEVFYKEIIEIYDVNEDGLLQQSEAETATGWHISSTVSSIKGIEYFVNLQILVVTGDKLESLEPVSNLTHLREIQIECPQISDFSPLYKCPIEGITLYESQIKDINFLANMRDLKELDLWACTEITDYSVLSELTDLTSLGLRRCDNLWDISFLTNMRGLKQLRMYPCTEITDYSVLPELTELYLLELTNCENMKDISFLANMRELKFLTLLYPDITDYSILSELTELEQLEIGGINFKDITVLKDMKKLESLTLSGCGAEDYMLLGEFINLNKLGINGCDNISEPEVEVLSQLTQLESFQMAYCNLKTLPDMTKWTNLQYVELSGNMITEEEAMAKLPAHITAKENWKETIGLLNQNNEDGTAGNEEDTRIVTSDSNSDISVQGPLESGIYLEAKKIEKSGYEDMIKQATDRLANIVDTSIYDIWLYKKEIKEGEKVKIKVQPDGSIKVMIKIQEQEDVSYHVFRQEDDGTLTKLDCYIEDSTLIFYSEHFSIFTVVISRLLDDEENETDGNSHKSDNGNYIKVQQQGLNVPLLHEAESNGGGIARPTDKIQNGDNAGNENISGSGNGISTKDENRSISLENEIKEADKPAGKIKDTDNGEQDKK